MKRIESFPRMWDQPKNTGFLDLTCRIIPTYVGSTHSRNCCSSRLPNHSHVCGINPKVWACDLVIVESFPRMWDQQSSSMLFLVTSRIIPTYVGSTQNGPVECPLVSNHSHVCGINFYSRDIVLRGLESFPRMWDQRRLQPCSAARPRIIPTYVGSTRSCPAVLRNSSNHSHVCGINPTNSFYFASGNTASCSFVLLENGL